MLQRFASLLALLSVIAAPAVTSTRLFCRYTGVEISGCDESVVPDQAQFRHEQCCQKRIFRALDGVRPVQEQLPQAPPPLAIGAALALHDAALGLPPSTPERHAAPSEGAPAFLRHRALLI